MDPSYNFSKIYDTLKNNVTITSPILWYQSDVNNNPNNNTVQLYSSKSDQLLTKKQKYNQQFENYMISQSLAIFKNKRAIKLADLDFATNITNGNFTLRDKTINDEFFYYLSNDDFNPYLKYRFPNGTFINNVDFLIKYPKGIDLVICNNENLIENCILGISGTKYNGNFLLKIDNLENDLSQQLIFILSQCFNKITIINPVGLESEKYVVCIERKWDVKDKYRMLKSSNFNQTLSDNYKLWLERINNSIIMGNNNLLDINNYYMYKLLAIWGLPSYALY